MQLATICTCSVGTSLTRTYMHCTAELSCSLWSGDSCWTKTASEICKTRKRTWHQCQPKVATVQLGTKGRPCGSFLISLALHSSNTPCGNQKQCGFSLCLRFTTTTPETFHTFLALEELVKISASSHGMCKPPPHTHTYTHTEKETPGVLSDVLLEIGP